MNELNPDLDEKLLFNILAAQVVMAGIMMIFSIIYFCSDSQASRFRMMAALIIGMVVYNLNYVSFPIDTVKCVIDNLFGLYYIYVAFMWAKQGPERSQTYSQFSNDRQAY